MNTYSENETKEVNNKMYKIIKDVEKIEARWVIWFFIMVAFGVGLSIGHSLSVEKSAIIFLVIVILSFILLSLMDYYEK